MSRSKWGRIDKAGTDLARRRTVQRLDPGVCQPRVLQGSGLDGTFDAGPSIMCGVRRKIATLCPVEQSEAEAASDIKTIELVAISAYATMPEVRRQLTRWMCSITIVPGWGYMLGYRIFRMCGWRHIQWSTGTKFTRGTADSRGKNNTSEDI